MWFMNRAFLFFSAVDNFFAKAFSPVINLILWGILGGILSMSLYQFLSSQKNIAECKIRLRNLRKEVFQFEGKFREILPLLRMQILLPLKQFLLVLWPTCVASIPLLFLFFWLNTERSYIAPWPETSIIVKAYPTTLDLEWSIGSELLNPGIWKLAWPSSDNFVVHIKSDKEKIVIPTTISTPTIYKYQWWNSIMNNPSGYIPSSSSLDKLYFMLTPIQIHSIGPIWTRSWEFIFFSTLMLTSILIKIAFKIN